MSREKILLSVQRALLGLVLQCLRAVDVKCSESEVVVTFIYDCDIDGKTGENIVELEEDFETQLISDFPNLSITIERQHTKKSLKITPKGEFAFLRHE